MRVTSDTDAMRRALDKVITRDSANSPSYIMPMEQGLALQIYPFRVSSWVGSFLAVLALLLTLIGIYGVLSYLVSQRTKEIGIRMALGAEPGGVVWMVLAQALKLASVGVAIGVALALGVSRLFASEIQMMNTFDLFAYGGAIATVLLAALAAAYFPSKRAAEVDPTSALRSD